MDLSLISQALMAVWSFLFGVIMFPFRTLQSWLSPVREEPHPEPQQTDDEFSPSSSRSSPSPLRYRVFLNFSGEDTRKNFTEHLHRNLVQAGIRTFMDDKEMEEGEEIGSTLFKAIKESRFSITIFSVNYASSKWCLNELVQIMECKDQQTVLPIFYDVDPRDVRKQTGDFGKKFEKLAKSSDAKTVESWRKALKKAGGLKGWDRKNWHEAKLMEAVIERVWRDFRNVPLDASKNLVGINSHVEDMKRLLNVESRGVRIVGICGMGGIGKTTLAEVVFNQILCNFEGSSFLGDVREVSKESRGLVSLQKQLLSDILKREIQSISSVTRGKFLINEGLQTKKVIIVLDDVDSVEQLEALAGGCDWFGDGSRLIITTRDEHVLNTHKVHEIYKLKGLDFDSSLQLFCNHAFGKDYPPKDHENLAKDVANTAGGLPLALKVLGSFLNDKEIPKEWISLLESLKKIHPDDIMKKLKISYDGLNKEEREIFLDIACFFIGSDKEEAIYIWKGSGFSPEITIKNLIHKSLIDIDVKNKLRMHDQLRDMAMQIIRQEQLDEPGERSRLWLHDEVLNVLKNFAGTKKVKGLLLKLEEQATPSEENCIYAEAFTTMSKLRLLCIDNANLVGSFKHFPSELTWFCWKRCPLECLPTDFHLEKLVVLDLSYSKITQVWNGPHQNKVLKNIRVLKLLYCFNLTETPDFQRLPNLVVLNLEGCHNLTELPGSICKLKSLETLILSSCSSLKNLPRDLGDMESLTVFLAGNTAIEYLPESIGDLKRLRRLSLNRCESLRGLPDSFGRITSSIKLELEVLELADCKLLRRLPVSIGFARNLTTLTLDGTSITELSNVIVLLEKLKTFSVRGCKKLKSLPELPLSLIQLFAEDCSSMDRLPDLSNLTNMTEFNLSRCTKLQSLPELPSSLIELLAEGCSSMERLPDLSNLTNMIKFNLRCCTKLQSLPELPSSLIELVAEDCSSMERLPDLSNLTNMIKFYLSGCKKLKSLPELPSSLIELLAPGCSSMERLPNLSNLTNLTYLECSGTSITELPDALESLEKLEMFHIRGCKKLQSLPELPSSLILLDAEDCSSMERLPYLSNLTNLVQFNLAKTSITELPDALGSLEKLEMFDIRGCKKLQSLPELPSSLTQLWAKGCSSMERLPDLSNLTNLVELECGGTSITEIPNGIALLEKLVYLRVSDCRKLVKLPDAIGRHSSLRSLEASNCNLSEGGILTAIGKLSLLADLNLDGNDFYSLPATISDMSHLIYFSVRNCRNLQSLPDLSNLKNLLSLDLTNCEKLVNIQDLKGLESLKSLDMNGCISVESLPEFPNFNKMLKLDLGNCEKLVDIQGIEKLGSFRYLNLSGCSRIPADTLRKCIVYPGIQSPNKKILFTPLEIRESYEEKRIRMVGPDRHSNGEQQHQKKMMEILLCFVFFNPREKDFFSNISVNRDGDGFLSRVSIIGKTNGDQICLLRFKLGQFEERDEISFRLVPDYGKKDLPIVKKAGMRVLYYEKEEEDESDHINYTTTVQSAYERIADFFFPLNDDDDDGGYGESNNSSSHRKRNNSYLLSDAREGGYFYAGKSKRQKKE